MLKIDLSNTVALVTGGARGIGAGIVRCMSQAGAATIFTHTGNPARREHVKAFVTELVGAGRRVEALPADACDPDAVRDVIQHVMEHYGRLDVLVANVGCNEARAVRDVTDEDWHRYMDVNLSSAFYAVRAALPPMLESGRGRILFIGSSAALDGGGGAIDYAASKAGLVGMMRYVVRSHARDGILCNVIHPCVIETELLRQRYDEDRKQALIEQVPAGRLGTPADVGALAAFLASPFGDFLCGQEFLVDGGRTFFR